MVFCSCNITDVSMGWKGVGAIGKPKAAQAMHWDSKSIVIHSVRGVDSHNPQGRPREPLQASWYPMESY